MSNFEAQQVTAKTAAQTYRDALNFKDDFASQLLNKNANLINATNKSLQAHLKILNDSKIIYPTAAVFALMILTFIIVFQKTTNVFFKIVAIVIFILFVLFTLLNYKQDIMG